MIRILVFLIVGTLCLTDANAQSRPKNLRIGPTFTVEMISKNREFKTGEQWVGEFKATATAPATEPLTIRAWSRFFANYDVIDEVYGPIGEATLSDALSTGGQVWRNGEPVVLWNAPVPTIFGKAAQTKVAAGSNVSATFTHHFGSAGKPGRFRQKVWFAIVVEPSPNRFMLLFAREPVDVEFVVQGAEIDGESTIKRAGEWLTRNRDKLHDSQSIYGGNKDRDK